MAVSSGITEDRPPSQRWIRLVAAWLVIRHLARVLLRRRPRAALVPGRAFLRIYADDPEAALAGDRTDMVRKMLAALGRAAPAELELATSGLERLLDPRTGPPWVDLVVTTTEGWEDELVAGVRLLARRLGRPLLWASDVSMRAERVVRLKPAADSVDADGPIRFVELSGPPRPASGERDGAGVTIAVIDTVLKESLLEPDLLARIERPATAVYRGWDLGNTLVPDPEVHAAAVIATLARVAPQARIVHVGLYEMTSDKVPSALELARRSGAQVINISLSVEGSEPEGNLPTELLDESTRFLQMPESFQRIDAVFADRPELYVVAPTGDIEHRGDDRAPMRYPASSEWTIAIGGVTNGLTLGEGSRYGGKDIPAPHDWWVLPCGDRIGDETLEAYATVDGHDVAGTSFAAAVASGLIACALQGAPPGRLTFGSSEALPDFNPATHGHGLFQP